jgi:hypothetical protein
MWTILLLLWSIPVALGLVALARATNGSAALSDHESRLFFGAGKQTRLSVWMGIKFAVLAAIFFVVGLVEGSVLLNFGMPWIVLAPLLTATGAVLLLAMWVRSGPSDSPRARQHISWTRFMENFSRTLSWYRGRFDEWRISRTLKRRKHGQTSTTLSRRYDKPEF